MSPRPHTPPSGAARHGSAAGGSLRALVAAALGLSFLWAASRVEPAVAFPPFSLAERVIRATPGDVATFFIERFQHAALPLLTVGVSLAFVALGAALGAVTHRAGVRGALLGSALFGLLSATAGLSAPSPPSFLPTAGASAGAGLLYGSALRWLDALAELHADPRVDHDRRRALVWLGGAAAAFFAGGSLLARFVERMAGPDTRVAIAGPEIRPEPPSRRPFPEIPGLSPEVTSAGDHYVVDIDVVDPVVEADGWTLEVGGAVARPLTLTFPELQSDFRVVEQFSVLTCVSNEVGGELVGSSSWRGPRLGEVLRRAGVRPDAVDVLFSCADGYTVTLPVDRAMHPTVLLAVAQNGDPLRQEHGFPCRVRAPALYGMMNAKWVREIRLVTSDEKGFWAKRGWSDVGVVRTQSRIDTRSDVRAGEPAWIAGVAWAGLRGIRRVEVSVDGGLIWRDARLRPPLSPYAWTQWARRWTPPRRGAYKVRCRATDGEGRRQDAKRRRPHPSGASGYHEVTIRAV